MAREKLITRTFQFTKAVVKVIDRSDDKTQQVEARVLGVYKNDEKLLEAIEKDLPFGVVVLCVMSKEEYTQKCSMTVKDFIKNSDLEVNELKED